MALTVWINSDHKNNSQLRDGLIDSLLDGTIVTRKGELRGFPYTDLTEENDMNQTHYEKLDSDGDIRFEGGLFYAILTEAKTLENVPVSYGEPEPITYKDYFQDHTQYPLADGTYLFRMTRKNKGLTDADRRIYQADLGTLLCRAEGKIHIDASRSFMAAVDDSIKLKA